MFNELVLSIEDADINNSQHSGPNTTASTPAPTASSSSGPAQDIPQPPQTANLSQMLLPVRPAFGSQHRLKTELYANYVAVELGENAQIHRYDFSLVGHPNANRRFNAEAKFELGKKRLRNVVRLFLEKVKSEKGLKQKRPKVPLATDYARLLFTTQPLFVRGETVDVEEFDERNNRATGYTFTFYIDYHQVFNSADVLKSLRVPNSSYEQTSHLQALNIILGHILKADPDVTTVGANKYFKFRGPQIEEGDLKKGLTALRGIFFSMRPAATQLCANIQIKSTAFYPAVSLETLIAQFLELNNDDIRYIANIPWGDKELRACDEFIKHLAVKIQYPSPTEGSRQSTPGGQMNLIKYRTVLGFAKKSDGRQLDHPPKFDSQENIRDGIGSGVDMVQFWLKKKATGRDPHPDIPEGYISVLDYYVRTGRPLRNTVSLCINVGTAANPEYVPAEFCMVSPGQVYRRQLNGDYMSNMQKFAVRFPEENYPFIEQKVIPMLGFRTDSNNYAVLQQFGVQPSDQLIRVTSRILESPIIHYLRGPLNKDWDLDQQKTKAAWNMNGKKFITPGGTGQLRWAFLQILRNRRANDISTKSVDEFRKQLQDYGIAPNVQNATYLTSLTADDVTLRLKSHLAAQYCNKGFSFLLISLPGRRTDTKLYNEIKRVCDQQLGIVNICVLENNLKRNNFQTNANVALKVNLKLGGTNHSLSRGCDDISQLMEPRAPTAMIIGLDVTHPSPGSSDVAPSIAAIVANSHPTNLGQWPGKLELFPGRVEIAQEQEERAKLEDMFTSRLQVWFDRNHDCPQRILIMRDGVSQGQYQTVLDEEFEVLKKAVNKFYLAKQRNFTPKYSVIIVGKRHNTRFYPSDHIQSDTGNPLSGTIVDHGVTASHTWDFYLQAHHAIKGTARPGHYVVLHDEIFNDGVRSKSNAVHMLENFVNRFCWLFGRATKAVSICPPAYYADILCERGRRYLSSLYDGTHPNAPDFDKKRPKTRDQQLIAAWEAEKRKHYLNHARKHLKEIALSFKVQDKVKDIMFYI
jgi:eukaryotic translation initiation factor 2C